METRAFGPTGVEVPIVGQGTWRMEQEEHAACIAALRRGLDLGLTHIDTAELYGSGEVEERIVSEAIAGRRDEVFLVSKVLPSNATYDGTLRACERSLRRLRTDRLDAYLLHWPGSHPLEGTIRAFEKLVADGKIRAWGLSNFDVPELEEALAIAGPGRIACNQVLYHLDERTIERRVIPYCREQRIPVVGYSPFGAGDFPGPSHPAWPVLESVARRHGATPRQVALRFLVRDPICWTIPKASKLAHVEDNARAASVPLDDADVERIAAAFPVPERDDLPVI